MKPSQEIVTQTDDAHLSLKLQAKATDQEKGGNKKRRGKKNEREKESPWHCFPKDCNLPPRYSMDTPPKSRLEEEEIKDCFFSVPSEHVSFLFPFPPFFGLTRWVGGPSSSRWPPMTYLDNEPWPRFMQQQQQQQHDERAPSSLPSKRAVNAAEIRLTCR